MAGMGQGLGTVRETGPGRGPAARLHARVAGAEDGTPCGSDRRERDELAALFERVASGEGWRPDGALLRYAGRSVYFGLWADASAVGGLQLVLADDSGGLPYHDVWPEMPRETRSPAAHIAVLALLPWVRGRQAVEGGEDGGPAGAASPFGFWLLCAELWRYCVLSGVRELWLEATPRTLRCYERLGWPLRIRGPLREHWGEPCYPCSLSVRETAGALAERAVRSPTYRQIMERALSGE